MSDFIVEERKKPIGALVDSIRRTEELWLNSTNQNNKRQHGLQLAGLEYQLLVNEGENFGYPFVNKDIELTFKRIKSKNRKLGQFRDSELRTGKVTSINADIAEVLALLTLELHSIGYYPDEMAEERIVDEGLGWRRPVDFSKKELEEARKLREREEEHQ